MHSIPITFEYKGKQYSGELEHVQGAGDSKVYHLMVNKYYRGRLRFTDKWVFDALPNGMFAEMGDEFGKMVERS